MKALLTWWRRLRHIVRAHEETMDRIDSLRRRIDDLDKIIRERTDIAVDVRFGGPSYVIVVGRYRNADYVQTYSVHADDLQHLIEMLRGMARHARVRLVDGPPGLRAVFQRETRFP